MIDMFYAVYDAALGYGFAAALGFYGTYGLGRAAVGITNWLRGF